MKNHLKRSYDIHSDQFIEFYDELPLWSAPFGLRLLDNVKLQKNITALDIGFGSGFPLIELAMRLGNTCRVYGIDPWETASQRVEKKIAFFNINNIELIRGEAENIQLSDHSIDVIVSNNGINNVSDLDKTLSECARILKSGGQLLLSMNLNTTMSEFYEMMERILREMHMNVTIAAMHRHIYAKRKPLDEFVSLLKKKAFDINNIDFNQFEYKFVDGTTMLNHYFIQCAFLESWKQFIPSESYESIFAEIENRMNKEAELDGFLKLSVPFVVIDCKRR